MRRNVRGTSWEVAVFASEPEPDSSYKSRCLGPEAENKGTMTYILCTDKEVTYCRNPAWSCAANAKTSIPKNMLTVSSPPPLQALHSTVYLAFQHNVPPFPTVSKHCLPVFFIPDTLKSSSTLSVHLSRGLPIFLVPLWLLQLILAYVGFAFFQHDHTILIGEIL